MKMKFFVMVLAVLMLQLCKGGWNTDWMNGQNQLKWINTGHTDVKENLPYLYECMDKKDYELMKEILVISDWFFEYIRDKKMRDSSCDESRAFFEYVILPKKYENHQETCVALAKKTDVNVQDENKNTPLMYAILTQQYRTFDAIMKRADVDINLANKWGKTALHYIAGITFSSMFMSQFTEYGQENDMCVKLAQNPKTDVNVKDEDGNTPLMIAIVNDTTRRSRCIEAIIDNSDVDVNFANYRYGSTALHFAASLNEKMCVKIAGKTETDVNVKDSNGLTPLMIASSKHQLECIEVLLQRDAGMEEKNKEEMTALDFAKNIFPLAIGKNWKTLKKIEKMFDRKRAENAANTRAKQKQDKKEADTRDRNKQESLRKIQKEVHAKEKRDRKAEKRDKKEKDTLRKIQKEPKGKKSKYEKSVLLKTQKMTKRGNTKEGGIKCERSERSKSEGNSESETSESKEHSESEEENGGEPIKIDVEKLEKKVRDLKVYQYRNPVNCLKRKRDPKDFKVIL